MHTPLTLLNTMSATEKTQFREWLQSAHPPLVSGFDELCAVVNTTKIPSTLSDKGIEPTVGNMAANEQLALLIPEFLANFSASPVIKLYNLLAQIQVLFERQQLNLCPDLIAKAKALAQQHFLLPELEKVLDFEQKLSESTHYTEYAPNSKTLFYEQSQVYEQLNNLWAYKELYLKVRNWGHLAPVKTDRVKWLMHLVNHPLLQSEKAAYSLNARVLYHAIKAIIFKNSDKSHEAFVHTKALMELFYQHADYAEIEWNAFLAALQQHAEMALQLQFYDDALMVSDFLKQIDTIYHFAAAHRLHSDLTIRALLIDIRFYKETLQLDKALELMPQIETILQSHASLSDNRFSAQLLSEIAQILLISGNFDRLIACIAKIYDLADACPDIAIQMQAQMLHAIALFETGNPNGTLTAHVAHMKQFFKDNHIYLRFETLFIDMMKKIAAQQQQGNATTQILGILQNYAILFDAVRAGTDTYFQLLIMAWLAGKLQNQPMERFLTPKTKAEAPQATGSMLIITYPK